MPGTYSLSPALPSPSSGVPVPVSRVALWFRRAILTHITPEASDLPGRIVGGLLSRSRSAGALGVLTLTTLALVSAATHFGLSVPLLGSLIGWILPSATQVILGIWAVRAVRRRFDSSIA